MVIAKMQVPPDDLGRRRITSPSFYAGPLSLLRRSKVARSTRTRMRPMPNTSHRSSIRRQAFSIAVSGPGNITR